MQLAPRSLVPRRVDQPPAPNRGAHEEDRQLVARMLAGDAAALDSFAERFGVAVYRFAAARLAGEGEGGRELVRDIVQTTLTKALARLETYRGEAALLTWLCACCRNEILMHRRRARPGLAAVDPEVLAALPDPAREANAEVVLLDGERAERVHLTLDSLPQHYARALEWKYVDQLPVEAIAAQLGLGLKAAESLLVRARRSFRDTYEDHAGGAPGGRGAQRAGRADNEP